MKKAKNNLDEMQELSLLRVEMRSFWIVFFGLVAAIVTQILVYQEEAGKYILGETAILLLGGLYCCISCVRRGIWDRSIPATPKANLLTSILIAGVFSVVLGIQKYILYGSVPGSVASAVVFFVSMTVLCFLALSICLLFYKKRKEKLEKDIED